MKKILVYMLIQNKIAIQNHKIISNQTLKFKTWRHSIQVSDKNIGSKPVAWPDV